MPVKDVRFLLEAITVLWRENWKLKNPSKWGFLLSILSSIFLIYLIIKLSGSFSRAVQYQPKKIFHYVYATFLFLLYVSCFFLFAILL
jgi:hypothetical protein